MDDQRQIFKDPYGKFSIALPLEWKYAEKKKTDKKALHQFDVAPACVFQISVNEVNDHIAKVIAHYKILPHDFDLPNISYVEEYRRKPDVELYNWMAWIDDQFGSSKKVGDGLGIYFRKPEQEEFHVSYASELCSKCFDFCIEGFC